MSFKNYQFTPTQDWFTSNQERWRALFSQLASPNPRALEIGSWEGRSAVFTLENLSNSSIVCIDHFDLHQTGAGKERYKKLQYNLKLTGKAFRVVDEFSTVGLMRLLEEAAKEDTPGYDWIYIDGSHEADDTLLDAEMVWRLARNNAIVVLDDYLWDGENPDSIHHPKRGIDAFMALHDGQFSRLSRDGDYQVVLRKTVPMRIGFLVKPPDDQLTIIPATAFGYGINMVLTVDSGYAAAAAVTIRSAVDHRQGRITVYIVDCGLTELDVAKLYDTLPAHEDVTLKVISLQQNSLARRFGAAWAKIDLIQTLPVERVMYLDADILVRESLAPLWQVDLGSHAIGAVRDVGFPMGHEAVGRAEYFNAGVLLIDLALARVKLGELMEKAAQFEKTMFQDQDLLNVVFRGDWKEISLCWNAQGLGTYASWYDADRVKLPLSELDVPKVVHFTGKVHPSMTEVLNPYLQPFMSKPWGYAGCPGNPYAGEWWECLEKTAWKGLADSAEWKTVRERKRKEVEEAVLEEFRDKLNYKDA
ncbi:glycosyltransferase family 8 protein [Flagelloscypha sp. PMI_526]|nr:glycosyltransferase family 8 protein [Flagelloscypha sp. PMI_526]